MLIYDKCFYINKIAELDTFPFNHDILDLIKNIQKVYNTK